MNRWDLYYLLGKTRWDTNITPPEIVALVEGKRIPPGAAIDLGCGTGTNVLYLQRHGYDAVGVDHSALAIRRARRKALSAGVPARFYRADLLDSEHFPAPGPFDFVMDIGVLHIWEEEGRRQYASTLGRITRPGSYHYVFGAKPGVVRKHSRWRGAHGPVGIVADDVRRALAPHGFVLLEAHDAGINAQGESRTGWYLSRRER